MYFFSSRISFSVAGGRSKYVEPRDPCYSGRQPAQEKGVRKSTYQVMVGPLADLAGLHTKVLERLGRLVNDLIVELALNLVGRHNVPPEEAVQETGGRLQERLGEVDVPALLENLPVDQLGNLGCRVVRRAVQLIRLCRRAVVEQHLFQCLADINDLQTILNSLHLARSLAGLHIHAPASTSPACGWP